LTIAKADATFAISGFAGTYDGAAHAATGTATGVNAESLTALLNLGASFTNAPGGTANWTFAGDANYKAAAGTAAITINKATPTIAWTAPASITSGTALGAAQLNATASVPGSFVYAPAAGTLLAVGNGQLLSVTFTPADTVDYNGAATSVSIDVTAPPVSVVSIAPIVDQSNIEGDEVELQVVVIGAGRVPSRRVSGGHDGQEERGDAFSAVGLPGGLDIDNDGEIRGRIKRDTAGTYNVTVTFTHNGVRVFQTFVWRVAAGAPRRSGTRG